MYLKKCLFIFSIVPGLLFFSCIHVLDKGPIDSNIISVEDIFQDPESYKLLLAKLYAGLAVTGQSGGAGQPDISGVDEGFSAYMRQYWCAQVLTTEEAVISAISGDVRDLQYHTWTASHPMVTAFYSRIFYQISLCNEYVRQVTPRIGDLDETLKKEVIRFLAEARFLRALSYWHALDHFGDVPIVTEKDPVGKFFPKPRGKRALFEYIESELKTIEPDLADPRENEYARADKACAWALLSKLYMNAEIYIGERKYAECIECCEKIIGAGYSLKENYRDLFLADNDKDNEEIIFPVAFDGKHTRSYGGTNFIIFSATGGKMNPSDMGISSGWANTRTTKTLVKKFPDETGEKDKRACFFTDEQSLEINNIASFWDGYAVDKFKNVTSDGSPGSSKSYVDTDYPVFRLADIYLTYAEAVLRDGRTGEEKEKAWKYVNDIRRRAYRNEDGDIKITQLTLSFLLDERARELYWEGHRRTDLIRYGLFTGGEYLWPWKGKQKEGIRTDKKYDLFPIPSSEIVANPELVQNPGY